MVVPAEGRSRGRRRETLQQTPTTLSAEPEITTRAEIKSLRPEPPKCPENGGILMGLLKLQEELVRNGLW